MHAEAPAQGQADRQADQEDSTTTHKHNNNNNTIITITTTHDDVCMLPTEATVVTIYDMHKVLTEAHASATM